MALALASVSLAALLVSHGCAPTAVSARRCAAAALSTLPTIADDDDDEEAALAREEEPVFLGDWDSPAEASRRLLLWLGVFVTPVLAFASVQSNERAEVAERALIVEALQKDIDRRNRPADEADDVESKAPAEPASDWTGSAEEWKQVIDEYRRPVDLGQLFNRKR
jgi:hypothetical protein